LSGSGQWEGSAPAEGKAVVRILFIFPDTALRVKWNAASVQSRTGLRNLVGSAQSLRSKITANRSKYLNVELLSARR
jgi:hypothetical protein